MATWLPADFENLACALRDGQPVGAIALALGKKPANVRGAINRLAEQGLELGLDADAILAQYGVPPDITRDVAAKTVRTRTGKREPKARPARAQPHAPADRIDAMEAQLERLTASIAQLSARVDARFQN